MTRTHLNKLGRDLILDIVNKTNASDITFAEVDFSTPEIVAGAGISRNTTVLVTALPNGRYKGERRVYYWRLPIQQVIGEEFRRFPMLGMPTNTLMIAQEINTRYNLRLTAEDIHVDPINELQKPFNVTIRIKPGSYAFLGEVTMQIVEPAVDLSDVITVNLLEGLYYPDDVDYRVGDLNFVQEGNGLLYIGAVNDTGLWVGNNGELEIASGFRIDGSVDSLAPTLGHNYTHRIGADWSMISSIELLDDTRGDDIVSMYDVTVQIIHEGGGDAELFLRKDPVTNTLYFEPNHGPAARLPIDPPPVAWGYSRLQLFIPAAMIRNAFINLDFNSGNAAGRFTVITQAKAKGTVLSPTIRIENTINVTRETVIDPAGAYQIQAMYAATSGMFPLRLRLVDPDNGFQPVASGIEATWVITAPSGRSVSFNSDVGNTLWTGGSADHTTWMMEGPMLTISVQYGNIYTTQFMLSPGV